MRLPLTHGEIRSWKDSDAESLQRHADNRNVWLNVRDRFPHPYTLEDARQFLTKNAARDPETNFAIVVNGSAVGGVGLMLREDVERVSAEIGYWLGEPYWGRGIMTDVVRRMTAYGIGTFGLTRIVGIPFEWNRASCRVLEKAGYVLEARMSRSAIKDGTIIDQFLYAFVVSPDAT